MTCYIVSFQAKDISVRQQIRNLLKTFKSYCPINTTCWAVVSDKKAAEIRDYLKTALARGDRLFVVRSGSEAAWRNAISSKHSDWLKKYL
jgi:hypothetical protein